MTVLDGFNFSIGLVLGLLAIFMFFIFSRVFLSKFSTPPKEDIGMWLDAFERYKLHCLTFSQYENMAVIDNIIRSLKKGVYPKEARLFAYEKIEEPEINMRNTGDNSKITIDSNVHIIIKGLK